MQKQISLRLWEKTTKSWPLAEQMELTSWLTPRLRMIKLFTKVGVTECARSLNQCKDTVDISERQKGYVLAQMCSKIPVALAEETQFISSDEICAKYCKVKSYNVRVSRLSFLLKKRSFYSVSIKFLDPRVLKKTPHFHVCLSFVLKVRQKSYKSRKNIFIKRSYTLKELTE